MALQVFKRYYYGRVISILQLFIYNTVVTGNLYLYMGLYMMYAIRYWLHISVFGTYRYYMALYMYR